MAFQYWRQRGGTARAPHLIRLASKPLLRLTPSGPSRRWHRPLHAAYSPLLFQAHRGGTGDADSACSTSFCGIIAAVIVERLVQGRDAPPARLPAGSRADVPALRRGGHGVWSHRDVAASRQRVAPLPLPRQAHRRLPAARGHACTTDSFTTASSACSLFHAVSRATRSPAPRRSPISTPSRPSTRCSSGEDPPSGELLRRSPTCPRSPRCEAVASWSGSTSETTLAGHRVMLEASAGRCPLGDVVGPTPAARDQRRGPHPPRGDRRRRRSAWPCAADGRACHRRA